MHVDEDECTTIVRQMWPYLDGALPDSWQDRVVEHLAGCETCRSHVDFEREFIAAIRAAGSQVGADVDSLRDRVLHALAGQGFTAV